MVFHHLILIILNQFLTNLVYNLKMLNITFSYNIYARFLPKKRQ